ncbi:glutamate--tRNA ligase [Alienimonas chondri]|nr:glutamate--tRNA ligase family protein [Alienimonas chondri]
MSAVRTRFAPSPTGYMHIGGMRTALFCWLLAEHAKRQSQEGNGDGGTFVLRVDDTDRARNVEAALAPILDAFRWLGLTWDEGPEVGGDHGPYFQSQRGEFYDRALQTLLDSGAAYRDFSSPEEVAADREAAQAAKTPYVTNRRSLELSAEEVEGLIAAGQKHVVRLKVPRDRTITVTDAIRGEVSWNAALLPDPALARADGSPLYNFASTVDDAAMKITHVVRAEEHLSNVPIQTLIFEALDEPVPTFAHIPFVTAPGTNRKLSKRDLSKYRDNKSFRKLFDSAADRLPKLGLELGEDLNPVMVRFYEEMGYLPEGLINALARLGWSLDDHTEVMSLDTVAENFTLDRVVKNPAGLDPDKLFSFQSEWMSRRSREDKVRRCTEVLNRAGYENIDEEFVGRLVDALGDRLKLYTDVLDVAYLFESGVTYDEKAFKKRIAKEGVPELLRDFKTERLEPLTEADWTPERLEEELTSFSAAREEGVGKLIHACRIATSGQPVGPGVYDVLALVGRGACLERIDAALARAAA